MQGIGSNPSYNPHAAGGGLDLDGVMSGVGSAFASGLSIVGTGASMAGSMVGSAATTVSTSLKDERTISNLGNTVANVGGSFWSSLSSGVHNVATAITQPEENDGLEELQRQFHSNRPAQSKYSGFGSGATSGGGGSSNFFKVLLKKYLKVFSLKWAILFFRSLL